MYLGHACTWLMYINDILLIWAGSHMELTQFMDELSHNSWNIRLTFTVDPTEIPFLDLSIRLEKGKLLTKTYRKTTAANTLLVADSHHPKSLIRGIPVGQFLRIRRNCSTEDDFRRESDSLYNHFRERGYSHCTLRWARKIAASKNRTDLLSPWELVPNAFEGPVRLIMQYGAQWKEIDAILWNHWHILTRPLGMMDIAVSMPHLVAKRASNLNDMLVHSKHINMVNHSWLRYAPTPGYASLWPLRHELLRGSLWGVYWFFKEERI